MPKYPGPDDHVHADFEDYVREQLEGPPVTGPTHDLYKTGDPDAPAGIKDLTYGHVVLNGCRRCGEYEAGLAPVCPVPASPPPSLPGVDEAWERILRVRDEGGLVERWDMMRDELGRIIAGYAERLAEVTRERDAYLKAKQENDERFMIERDAATAEAKRLKAELLACADRVYKQAELLSRKAERADPMTPLTPDDRAALVRVRRVEAKEDVWSVYGNTRSVGYGLLEDDLWTVARLALAAYPADGAGVVPADVLKVATENRRQAGAGTCDCAECVMARFILRLAPAAKETAGPASPAERGEG